MQAAGRVPVPRRGAVFNIVRVGDAKVVRSGRRERVSQVGIEPEHIFTRSVCIVIRRQLRAGRIEKPQVRAQPARPVDRRINIKVDHHVRRHSEFIHIDVGIRQNCVAYRRAGRGGGPQTGCFRNLVIQIGCHQQPSFQIL